MVLSTPLPGAAITRAFCASEASAGKKLLYAEGAPELGSTAVTAATVGQAAGR
jgi:hypothetical protein